MAYKQNNNPLSTPILKVEMDNNVMGKANKDGSIHINKNISDPKEIQDIVEHESVHLDQMQRGDLDYDDNNVIWKGKKYSRNDMKEGAKNLPWEKEAYQKTEGSRKFKLNSHRGNNNSYQSFQDKGLISPLNQNPPPFKFKDLFNKSTRTSTSYVDREVNRHQPGYGNQTPGLFTKADDQWLADQNKLQQEKSLNPGYVGITIDAGGGSDQPDPTLSTTTSSPTTVSGGKLNSSTKGKGVNVSGERDLTYNQRGADMVSAGTLDSEDFMLMDQVGQHNFDAYDNNPNYEYKVDSSGGTTEHGYYDKKTGQKAPEMDNSKKLAKAGNLFAPKSYNIFGTDAMVHAGGGVGDAQQGNYSTNYQFASQPQLLIDQEFATLPQSHVREKGAKYKEMSSKKAMRRRKADNFQDAKVRTKVNPFASKYEKTILPKRKITYETQLVNHDGKQQIRTIATKKFDRKKYDDTKKYYSTHHTSSRGGKLMYDGEGEKGRAAQEGYIDKKGKYVKGTKARYIANQKNIIDTRAKNLAQLRNLQNP